MTTETTKTVAVDETTKTVSDSKAFETFINRLAESMPMPEISETETETIHTITEDKRQIEIFNPYKLGLFYRFETETINKNLIDLERSTLKAFEIHFQAGAIWNLIKNSKKYLRHEQVPAFEYCIKGLNKADRTACAKLAEYNKVDIVDFINAKDDDGNPRVKTVSARTLLKKYREYLNPKAKTNTKAKTKLDKLHEAEVKPIREKLQDAFLDLDRLGLLIPKLTKSQGKKLKARLVDLVDLIDGQEPVKEDLSETIEARAMALQEKNREISESLVRTTVKADKAEKAAKRAQKATKRANIKAAKAEKKAGKKGKAKKA